MDLQEILKAYGMPVGDIRTRISNGSVKLNDEVVTDPRMDIGDISEVVDFGKFIDDLSKKIDLQKYNKLIITVGIDNLMSGETNIKNELTEYLKDWMILRISGTYGFFMKKGESDERGVLFRVEGNKPEWKKIEVVKSGPVIDIDKLKKDLEVVNKQLSNPSFIEKAPKFKVEEAKQKKERILRQLAESGVSESLRFLRNFKEF